MADFSIDQLDIVQAGTATADILKKAANVARNSACGFFHDHPSTVIPIPDVQFIYGLWDGFCANSNSGLPPAATPPFSGGQCPTSYTVTADWEVLDTSNGQITPHHSVLYTNNKIDSIDLTNYANDSVGLDVAYINSFSGLPAHAVDKYGYSPRFVAQNLHNLNVSRTDGQPDTCGNPPSKFPPDTNPPPPTTPGGDTYNLPPVTFTYNDNRQVSVAPTLTIDGGGGLPSINFGGINVSLGGGGVTVTGGGGTGTGGSTTNTDNGNSINNIKNDIGGIKTDIGGIKTDIGGIKTGVDGITKNTNPPPPPGGPGTKPPDVKPPTQKKNDGLANLISVQVVLTKLPPEALIVFAQGTANNVMYTGWFNWRQAGHDLSKQQITYADNIFLAPKGVDGYSFTLTHGSEGYAIENTGTDS